MKPITKKSSIVFTLMLLTIQVEAQEFRLSESCFFVSMADSKSIIAGINEDNLDLRSKVWFIPGTGKTYGRVLWGFDRGVYPYQGGMNQRGLFFDINTCADTGWKEDPGKSNFDVEGDLVDYILSNIATVDEVIDFFDKYNIDLSGQMWVFADANKKSVILEVVSGQLKILKKGQGYQICTNNVQSGIDIPNTYPCDRWRIADQILKDQKNPSVDLIRRVLSATSAQFYFVATDYSAICDLVNKKIYLYNFHNYEEAAVFDLKKELAKGGTSYSFLELFKVQPYSFLTHRNIGAQWADQKLKQVIDEKGIREGINELQEIKDAKRSYDKYIIQEWVIKSVGLQYIAENRIDDAIEVFKLNVLEYPDSWEVYSDLASAYLKKNNIPLAIQYYQKALEKKPDEQKTAEILKKLMNQKEN
jgi:tetratricopeptide (TPR) repeat protein